MKNIRVFLSENFQFLEVTFSVYFNRRVFVMTGNPNEDVAHKIRPWGYTTFFMLNSAEHGLCSADKSRITEHY